MIQRPNNWDEVQEQTEIKRLPLGAYVCRIKRAVIKEESYGTMLNILYDIEDGEYAGYYGDMFKADTNPDKKWKGVLRYFLPRNDGSEQDEWTKSTFKGLITSIEKSNPGYKWNWDEKTFANKLVGVTYQDTEWEYNDKHGWSPRPYRATSVQSIEDGTYYQPKAKPLKGSNSSPTQNNTAPTFQDLSDDDGQLPF